MIFLETLSWLNKIIITSLKPTKIYKVYFLRKHLCLDENRLFRASVIVIILDLVF